MTGIVVGARGLSIWALVSQMATQEKNKYYTIHWAANSNIGDEILLFTFMKLNIQINSK